MVSDLYPFESHFFDRDGIRLHYLDEGSGPPVVMVHGNPTWSFTFRNLVLALRSAYRVVVPDHIGCGLSDKPDDSRYSYRLQRRAEDLEALLDHLGIREKVTLVLHDWGGMIGMTYAHWHPERVQRFVILNTGAFHLPRSKPFPWQLALCRNRFIGPLLVRGLNAFSRAAVRLCSVKPLPPAVRSAYLSPYDSWKNRIAVLRFVQDIPLRPGDPSYDLVTEVQEGLHRFQDRPMLICWGEQDFVFDRHFLEEWQRRFPGAEVHRFPEAGHLVLEDAGEPLEKLIRSFMSS